MRASFKEERTLCRWRKILIPDQRKNKILHIVHFIIISSLNLDAILLIFIVALHGGGWSNRSSIVLSSCAWYDMYEQKIRKKPKNLSEVICMFMFANIANHPVSVFSAGLITTTARYSAPLLAGAEPRLGWWRHVTLISPGVGAGDTEARGSCCLASPGQMAGLGWVWCVPCPLPQMDGLLPPPSIAPSPGTEREKPLMHPKLSELHFMSQADLIKILSPWFWRLAKRRKLPP